MRAVDVCLLILFINIGISAMVVSIDTSPGDSSTGLFDTGVDAGMSPDDMSAENLENMPGSGLGSPTLGNIFISREGRTSGISSIMVALGIIITTAVVGGAVTDASIIRIGGISLFAGVFWWVCVQTNSILTYSYFNLPSWMLNIITAIFGAVFFLAVVELTTGQRTEGY